MQALESTVREHADAGGSFGSEIIEQEKQKEILRRRRATHSIYKLVLTAMASLNGALNPHHELHAQEKAVTVKAEAEENEEEEELPAFKTMEEWDQSPILTDKERGLYSKMRAISKKYRGTNKESERNPLRKETEELAGIILGEIGNPYPPTLDTAFLRWKVNGFDRQFIDDLRRCLERRTLLFPFKIMPGQVNGQMVADYIVKTTRLPIALAADDMATRHALATTNVRIAKDNKMWQVLAELCNNAKVDLDVAPVGSDVLVEDALPKHIILARLGPWSRQQYQASLYGVSVSGSIVESDGCWSYVSGSENQSGNGAPNVGEYWMPESLTVRHPMTQKEEQWRVRREMPPLRDPETGALLCFDRKKNAFVFGDHPEQEKLLEDEPLRIVWRKPYMGYFPLQEWHQKMMYGMITPPGYR